jgi:exodeoxyribonuclease VIII
MRQHVMIDLETMGTGSYAPILSIGAVKFEPRLNAEMAVIDEEFHVGINLESCIKAGLRPEADTINWWLDPDRDAARRAMHALPKVDLFDALDGFAKWYGPKPLPTWGNGAAFDNVLMVNAYKQVALPCPWTFKEDRCFRTLRALSPIAAPERAGHETAHDALSDARYQVQWLRAIYVTVP